MTKVEYSSMVLEDLQYLRGYVIDHWGESAAKRILKKITSDIKRLEAYPVLGISLAKHIDAKTDYRYLFSENFVMPWKRFIM